MSNRYKKITKTELNDFLRNLKGKYPIFGPVENTGPVDTENEYKFANISTVEEIVFNHPPTMIPPKKYFFPSKETLLEITEEGTEVPEFEKHFVIVGVHPCDINSFLILDKMFRHGEYRDTYYERRRNKGIVIGVDCEPTDTCFCKSMDAYNIEEGYDLFLYEFPHEDSYIVDIGSEKGQEIASSASFQPVNDETAEKIIDQSKEWEEEVAVDTEELPANTLQAFDDETIWEELGERCLGCGSCTMVCPCCNCFDIKDEKSLETDSVKRSRSWTACTLLEFAEVSGGNFRVSNEARYRNWFYDKFRIFPKDIDEFGCVGCGRCVSYCPVDIDPRKTIKKVREKYAR